jgi:hypothetical protein
MSSGTYDYYFSLLMEELNCKRRLGLLTKELTISGYIQHKKYECSHENGLVFQYPNYNPELALSNFLFSRC